MNGDYLTPGPVVKPPQSSSLTSWIKPLGSAALFGCNFALSTTGSFCTWSYNHVPTKQQIGSVMCTSGKAGMTALNVVGNVSNNKNIKKAVPYIAGAVAFVAAPPLLLAVSGFGVSGVTAGSLAAAVQGSSVASGSMFALCQSAGAAGLSYSAVGLSAVTGLGFTYKFKSAL